MRTCDALEHGKIAFGDLRYKWVRGLKSSRFFFESTGYTPYQMYVLSSLAQELLLLLDTVR